MRYPKLVRKSECKIPIAITIYSEELSENGEPVTYGEVETLCNYQSNAKRVLDEQQQVIELRGTVLLSDDIFPELGEITGGEVEILGEKRNIYRGSKARNPDGTINYVKLELR